MRLLEPHEEGYCSEFGEVDGSAVKIAPIIKKKKKTVPLPKKTDREVADMKLEEAQQLRAEANTRAKCAGDASCARSEARKLMAEVKELRADARRKEAEARELMDQNGELVEKSRPLVRQASVQSKQEAAKLAKPTPRQLEHEMVAARGGFGAMMAEYEGLDTPTEAAEAGGTPALGSRASAGQLPTPKRSSFATAAINRVEKATGLDLDRDGDVGRDGAEADIAARAWRTSFRRSARSVQVRSSFATAAINRVEKATGLDLDRDGDVVRDGAWRTSFQRSARSVRLMRQATISDPPWRGVQGEQAAVDSSIRKVRPQ